MDVVKGEGRYLIRKIHRFNRRLFTSFARTGGRSILAERFALGPGQMRRKMVRADRRDRSDEAKGVHEKWVPGPLTRASESFPQCSGHALRSIGELLPG
jgi:hypothetical protein